MIRANQNNGGLPERFGVGLNLETGRPPHLRGRDSVRSSMSDVLIALAPVLGIAVYYYGLRVLFLSAVSVACCIGLEALWGLLFRRSGGIGDLSAVVTGLITALNLPACAPWWFPILGAFVSIIIVKQIFGGLGKNVFNPALTAIVFLTVTWPKLNLIVPMPFPFGAAGSFRTTETALLSLKQGVTPTATLMEMFLGDRAGAAGTGAVFILLVAAVYLLYRRVIDWRTPAAMLATVAAVALLLPRCPAGRGVSALYELMSGSVLFAAVFMATDPVTSPSTGPGRAVSGVLCGLTTAFLRYNGIFPEGVYFALLLTNPLSTALDLGWLRLRQKRLAVAARKGGMSQ